MGRKKVLMFLHDGVGGAELIAVLVGKELDRQQFEVVLCLVDRGWSPSIRSFIPEGYRIISIPDTDPLRRINNIRKTLVDESPQVVFSSVMSLSTKILLLRNFFPNIKFIIRCENYLYSYNRIQHYYIKLTYHRSDVIIAQTEEMKDELMEEIGIAGDKIIVLHNPVDTNTIRNQLTNSGNPYPEDEKKHVVASGRFVKDKGFDILVRSFCKLAKEDSNIDLYIIGNNTIDDGSILHEINEVVKENNLTGRVHCPGFQTEPYKWIKYADCFVLSSRLEGLPNVLIEALYLGTPCAAVECVPVVGRIIEEGVTGYLAEMENVDSLALAMKKAVSLGHIESQYKSATIKDFEKLFNI